MSLYPEQKKLIDQIYGKLSKPETAQAGMVDVQIQLMIQWMLIANAHEVMVESMRDLAKRMAPTTPMDSPPAGG